MDIDMDGTAASRSTLQEDALLFFFVVDDRKRSRLFLSSDGANQTRIVSVKSPPCCVWVSPCITHTDPSQHTRRRQDCVSSSSWSIKSPTVEFLILSSSIPSEKKRLPNLIWTFKWNFFKIFWWKADSNSNWDRGEHASMLFLCCRGNHRNCERNTVGGRAAVNWDLSIDQLYRPTVPQCPV